MKKKLPALLLCFISLFVVYPVYSCSTSICSQNLVNMQEVTNPTLVDNSRFSDAIRALAKSYLKRQVKQQGKYFLRQRYGKMKLQQAANYAVDNAYSYIDSETQAADKQHILTFWNKGQTNMNHFNRCQICRRVGDDIITATSYTAAGSVAEPNMVGNKKEKKHLLKPYNGTRINLSFSMPRVEDAFHGKVIEEGTMLGGGSASLEYQIAVLQFETGYKYFTTQHEDLQIEEYNLSSIYGIGSITLPWLQVIAPSIGGGYQLGRIDYQQNGQTTRFDNNGLLLQGALSINPSPRFSIQGRYHRFIQTDAFEGEVFEVGIKFKL